MSWVTIIVLILKIVNAVSGYLRDQQGIEAGADAEIAKASAAILVKTQAAKDIMKQVTGMTDEEVDQTLKGLEP